MPEDKGGKRGSKRLRFDYKKVVTTFYKKYAPEKVRDVGKVLEHFDGREDDLIKTLESKYSVVFHRDGTFTEVDLDEEEDYTDASDDGEPDSEYSTDDGDDDDDDEDDGENSIPEEIMKEVEFSYKSDREKAAELARSAALIAQARPAPKRISKRLSQEKKSKKRESYNKEKEKKKEQKEKRSSKESLKKKDRKKRESKKKMKRNKHALPGKSMHGRDEHLEKPGAKIWVPDKHMVWVRGKVVKKDGPDDILIELDSGAHKQMVVSKASVEPILETDAELSQVHDLTKLPALHEPALLQALENRFDDNQIYTYTGPILLAVNPFKQVDLYGTKQAAKYMESSKGYKASKHGSLKAVRNLTPHAYKLADDAFRNMLENDGANQSILVSGESGAGKTETTKIVLNYLSYVSSQNKKSKRNVGISERILRANPLLEAFGNAKTLRNDNSSRFGKMIQVSFDEGYGSLKGAYIDTYLLEKFRVVRQAQGERNYHIFYELAAGASTEQKKRWKFPKSLKNCRYTGRSNTFKRDDIDDLAQFKTTLNAMETLRFSPSDMEHVFRTVVAVLHLGNIDFKEKTNKEGLHCAKIVNEKDALLPAADLLEVDPERLAKVLTTRRINVGGNNKKKETLERPLNGYEAEDARDALAMNLYERLFGWIIWRTNLSIGLDDRQYQAMLAREEQQRQYEERKHRRGDDEDEEDEEGKSSSNYGDDDDASSTRDVQFGINNAFAQALMTKMPGFGKNKLKVELSHDNLIGCLDIFGFEVFENNTLNQLLINYTNETLQRQFNQFIFEIEQLEYTKEGLDWQFIQFPDNSECIAMIESKPMGLLSLLDEECLYPKGTDESLLVKLHKNLPKKYESTFLVLQKDRVDQSFTVRHFAGEVTYSIEGFCKKNRNELHQDVVDAVRSSSDRIVCKLFPHDADAAAGGADMASYFNSLVQDGRSRSNSFGRESSFGPPQKGTKLLKTTVSSHFKSQLQNAMEIIRSSQPHYIRCLKPNDDNKPNRFDRHRMVSQLRYCGVLELVRVTRAGYPSRVSLNDFVKRFAVLSYGVHSAVSHAKELNSTNKQALTKVCEKICKNAKLKHGEDYQIGYTKVFLRQSSLAYLEMKKAEKTFDCVVMIQRTFRKYRADFREERAALKIQRNVRGFLVRKEARGALQQRQIAAELIQTNPHFIRWMDYIMRKAAAKRRRERRKRHARQGWTFKKPKFYLKNREMFWWLSPIFFLYILPNIIWTIMAFIYKRPAVPILLFILIGAMVSGAYGATIMNVTPKQVAGMLGFKQVGPGGSVRGKKVKKSRRTRSKGPSSSSSSSRKLQSSRSDRKIAIPKVKVSERFSKRAAKLRQSKQGKSQVFEMPVPKNQSSRFRGLRRNKGNH